MWILTFFLLVTGFAAIFTGYQPWFTIDRLTKNNVLNGTLIVLIAFTILMIAYVKGYFPQSVAAPTMMAIYSIIAGFFLGYAYRLITLRKKAGRGLYQHRSFWIDHAPNILAIILILYGIYRTAFLTDEPITGIRISSGISLISFGIFIWTLHAVPEFRSNGIILLDRFIHWRELISWGWYNEYAIKIEYLLEDDKDVAGIRQFITSIPEDEKKEIEFILSSKMDEHEEHRMNNL